MNGSAFNAMNGLYERFTLDRHLAELEKAEDEAERNTAHKLTIQDHKKDNGFGRYVVRGDGETIYGGNDMEEAIEAIAMHFLEMEG